MIAFYKLQGVVADFALAMNMLFIMGLLSAFGVTLTLPGIAGLVLTLGMAVDGNRVYIADAENHTIRLAGSDDRLDLAIQVGDQDAIVGWPRSSH